MLKLAARFWRAPRATMRAVLETGPGEAQLIALLMLGIAIMLAGRLAVVGLTPAVQLGIDGDVSLAERVSAEIAGALVVWPLAFYGLAALCTLIARAFGGQATWRAGRTAVFWALLMAAPALAASDVLSQPQVLRGLPGAIAGQAGPVLFAWALAQCIAETFGFGRTWAVFGVLAAIVLVPLAVLWMLHG